LSQAYERRLFVEIDKIVMLITLHLLEVGVPRFKYEGFDANA